MCGCTFLSKCVSEVSRGGAAAVAERAPGSLIPDQRVSRASGAFSQAVTLWSGASGQHLSTQGPGLEGGAGWELMEDVRGGVSSVLLHLCPEFTSSRYLKQEQKHSLVNDGRRRFNLLRLGLVTGLFHSSPDGGSSAKCFCLPKKRKSTSFLWCWVDVSDGRFRKC